MKALKRISLENWMSAPQTKRLLLLLPDVRFVGGCVRDALLNKEVEDIDLATTLKPKEIMDILEGEEGISVIPTGLKHGTLTVVIDKQVFEITTLRKDERTDGRHAEISYTDDWVEDACRRDFTINTLLMDGEGNIYDPLGEGLKDIEAQRLVFVGDPAQRIEEDHLRILRFFRFSALYADEYNETGLKACKKAANKIKKLSKERITQEYFKIIAAEKPQETFNIMFENNVLKEFEFPDYNPDFLGAVCHFQSSYRLTNVPARIFTAAALDFNNIKAMEEFILFPKVFLRDMKAINGALTLPDLSCDSAVKECIYRYGRGCTAQALMIELAQDRVMNRYAPTALKIIQSWNIPTFPLSGEDLIKEGIKQGPELGLELQKREEAWIKGGFPSSYSLRHVK